MLTEYRDGIGTYMVSGQLTQYHYSGLTPPQSDPLASALGFYEFISPQFPLLDITSRIGAMDSEILVYLGLAPGNRDPRSLIDFVRWSTYVANVRHLFSDWDFRQEAPKITSENPVSHFNLNGEVETGLSESAFYRCFLYPYESIPDLPLSSIIPLTQPDGTTVFTHGVPMDWPNGQPTGYLVPALPSIQSEVDAGEYDTSSHIYKDFQYLMDGDYHCRYIMYTLYITTFSGGWWKRRAYVIRYGFDLDFTPQEIEDEEPVSLSILMKHYVETRWVSPTSQQWLPGHDPGLPYPLEWTPNIGVEEDWTYSNVSGWHELPFHLHLPTFSKVDEMLGYQPTKYYHTHPKSLQAFRGHCLTLLSDCFPANFFSSKEAVDKHFERLSSNHIEALMELGDIVRLIDVYIALRELRRNPGRGLSLITRLLHLLTDVKLSYSLGVAPSISDATEIAERSTSFLSKFSSPNLFGENTIYGKFNYEIPSSFNGGFSGLRLIARSKIRVSVPPDTFLSGILPVRSLGLLPTLSSLWDLVPFSFVIDWFTHIGAKLDDVETQALMLVLNISVSVHSIQLVYPFSSDDEEEYSFRSVTSEQSGEDPGYRFYCRYVMNSMPALGRTRFPFHGSAYVPDWGTAGSLVFKGVK